MNRDCDDMVDGYTEPTERSIWRLLRAELHASWQVIRGSSTLPRLSQPSDAMTAFIDILKEFTNHPYHLYHPLPTPTVPSRRTNPQNIKSEFPRIEEILLCV
jgi:hypothetical protein